MWVRVSYSSLKGSDRVRASLRDRAGGKVSPGSFKPGDFTHAALERQLGRTIAPTDAGSANMIHAWAAIELKIEKLSDQA